MKRKIWLTLMVSLVLPFITCKDLQAREIINGYTTELANISACLKNVRTLLGKEQDQKRLLILRKHLDRLESMESRAKEYYQETELLLAKFRLIDPQLYNEINFIRDRKSNITNVYIKIIPFDPGASIMAATLFDQSKDDSNICVSTYGQKSISIDVVDVQSKSIQRSNSLILLAHEFGHIKYMIPNLENYFRSYKKISSELLNPRDPKGHLFEDPSGILAEDTSKNFTLKFREYLREAKGGISKFLSYNK